ncbi:lantibiotic dehydratase [Priestia megaterium]
MSNINFVSHFLCRVAGKNVDSNYELEFSDTITHIKLTDICLEEIRVLSEEISEMMHQHIRMTEEASISKKLINLKRDIYNLRINKVKKSDLENVNNFIRTKINKWIEKVNTYEDMKRKTEDIFKKELSNKRNILKSILRDEKFIKAVQMSNINLYKNLIEYLEDENDILSKKMRNTEQSLINYLNRMIFKPTPFSTFTSLNYGFFKDESSKIEINTQRYSSYVRSNLIYLKTVERMLLNLNSIKKNSFIIINPTIDKKESNYKFFRRGNDGTNEAFSKEAFITLKANNFIDNLLTVTASNKIYSFKDIVNIFSDSNRMDEEYIFKYLLKLESVGFLNFTSGVSEQSNTYLKDLIEFIKGVKDPIVCRSSYYLTKIDEIQSDFSTLTHEGRYICLGEIANYFKEIYKLFGVELNIDTSTSLLFEDTTYNDANIKLNKKKWVEYLPDFQLVRILMPLFDDNLIEKIGLNIIFHELYDKEQKVNLLEFYQTVNNYDKNLLWEKIRKDDTYNRVKYLRKEFYTYLDSEILKGVDVISLDKKWIVKFAEKFPPILRDKNNYSFYFQIFHDKGKEMIVLNKLGPGMGKHFSRYGNLFLGNRGRDFNSSIVNTYKEHYENPNRLLTDLNAVLGLNLNTHPKFLDYEITYPGSVPNFNNKQLSLKDIDVFYSSQSHNVELYHRIEKKVIELLPLGFLFPMLAPPLYKFLTGFSKVNGIEYSFWNKFCNEVKKDYFFLPRINIGSITIDRKTWKIDSKDLQNNFDKDSLTTFIQLKNWMEQKKLPKHIFLRIANAMDAFSEDQVLNQDLSNWIAEIKQTKHRKPQYINFYNFFHIEVLKKIIRDVDNQVTFQEVLPHPDEMSKNNSTNHYIEFLIECFDKE